jgi:hypothetical protein
MADTIPYIINQSSENSPFADTPDKNRDQDSQDDLLKPTKEELTTLRRVSGKVPLVAYSLCMVEFAERASYYGCTFVFSNFIQFPLP